MANPRLCSIQNCGKPAKQKGWCWTHYTRWHRYGDVHAFYRVRPTCKIDGCIKPHKAHGYCADHYYRLRSHGHPEAGGTGKGERLAFIIHTVLTSDQDECLIWPFSTSSGYGTIRVDGLAWPAHRFVCAEVYGPCPDDKQEAAHSCGVRACVNPKHIRWATYEENNADKLVHGTQPRGENHVTSKLTEDDVRAIRSLRGQRTQRAIAAQFGISQQQVSDIQTHKRWGWL